MIWYNKREFCENKESRFAISLLKKGSSADAVIRIQEKGTTTMDLLYRSTRDSSVQVTASQAILKGLSADGGLFVPMEIPALNVSLAKISIVRKYKS